MSRGQSSKWDSDVRNEWQNKGWEQRREDVRPPPKNPPPPPENLRGRNDVRRHPNNPPPPPANLHCEHKDPGNGL